MTRESFTLGIDVGSVTAKVVLLRHAGSGPVVEASAYLRHEARVEAALLELLQRAADRQDPACIAITGSAGMGLAERVSLPFVQEVRALCALARSRHPEARTLLDIGGEDAKLVFLGEDGLPDARMNSGCAGGTGAFLDQMAALLSIDVGELEQLARQGERVHPVASRCGVFAKTDVQSLLSAGASRPDVALSIFHAMALQVIAALARGRTPAAPVLMTGGPLTFLPTLRGEFGKLLNVGPDALLLPECGALACAEGAALLAPAIGCRLSLTELRSLISSRARPRQLSAGPQRLFADEHALASWTAARFTRVPRVSPREIEGELFLGIDSGSTTTKLALVDAEGRMAADAYEMNQGDPLGACRRGLAALQQQFAGAPSPTVRAAAATGYGEDLVRAAFGIDSGLVETEAHFRAARALAPDVTFVLDIGGQDMKALFVRDGALDRIEVNEACSSGCGTFLQTFAEGLSLTVGELAGAACRARAPRDLGSRCTVFMNSMVKQALREGAGVEDIAAGLSYSVARNCLQKVLKLRDFDQLGATVVVQGGTFLNPSVHRAFELLTGRRVVCPDQAGLAGAWGAALHARDATRPPGAVSRPLSSFLLPEVRSNRTVRCRGCENCCPVTLIDFQSAGRHVAGNRCDRVFHNGNARGNPGVNHLAAELDLLLRRPLSPSGAPHRQRIGIPLALGTYENLPFWTALLVRLGHEVVLSGTTDRGMVEEAASHFCSDSVCLPARIAGAHLMRLHGLGVDRVLFPMVFYEAARPGTGKPFNCPIVTGYPEVVASILPRAVRERMPVGTPPVSFRDSRALRTTARRALAASGIEADGFDEACEGAWDDYQAFLQRRREMGLRAVEASRASGRPLVLLACRPYHLDPYLNHGVPGMLASLGYDVVSSQWLDGSDANGDGHILGQWAYPNRILEAAAWTSRQPDVRLVQLNSFGCGPDAIVADEAVALMASRGKAHSLLRIDESSAPGSIRLRLRTLEVGTRAHGGRDSAGRASTPPFLPADRHRTIITAPFAPLLSLALRPEFARLGYAFETSGETDRESLELGLKYVNNEICYPAILTVGDILKALRAHRGPRSEIAVGLTQTGGPCRASNYVPVLKKAMVSAGFGDVPVVGVRIGVADALNEQPGFTINRRRLLTLGLQTIAATDAIAMMARSLAVRERTPGESARTAERLVREWSALPDRGFAATIDFVDYACREMSAIPTARDSAPRVGIVGEIYVKHSAFANRHLVDWLVGQGIEPVIPPLSSFFAQEPLNAIVNRAAGLDDRRLVPALARFVDAGLAHFFTNLNRRLERFGYPVHFPVPRELAAKAARVLSLTHQYGEGWVLGGEIVEMAEHGVTKVVCLQPFGCIANQVIARGIEARLRALHPSLELLFVDLDHNTSDANLFNRLELLVAPPLEACRSVAV